MKKRTLLAIMCVVMIIAASALTTLAYLTWEDSVKNTFTIGHVEMTLDEAKVNPDGTPVLDDNGDPVDRVKGNEYHLIPGQTYTKDPTLTVKADSEESYVRMMLTINCVEELDAIFAPDGIDLAEIFNGYDPATWLYQGNVRNETDNTITYEFRYKETVTGAAEDFALDALFDSFTLPGEITGDQLKTIEDLTITVTGHAIQAAGFEGNEETGLSAEDAAWAAFDDQTTPVQGTEG